MRLVLLTLLSFLLIQGEVSAQSFGWVNTAVGNDDLNSVDVITADNEDYLMLVNYEGTINVEEESLTSFGSSDVFVARYDSSGAFLWAESFGGFGDVEGTDISTADSSDYLVSGIFEGVLLIGDTTLVNENGHNALLALFDESAELIWAINIDSSSDISNVHIDYNETSGFGVVCGTYSGSISVSDTTVTSFGQEALFVLRFNGQGEIEWLTEIAVQEEIIANAVAINNEEEIAITGYFEGNLVLGETLISNSSDADLFVVNLDVNGEPQWIKSAGGGGDVEGNDLVVFDEGWVIVGEFDSSISLETVTLNSLGDVDGFLMNIDSSGNEQWVSQMQGEDDVQPAKLITSVNNSILVCGTTEGDVLFDELSIYNSSNDDLFYVVYDLNGEAVAVKSIGGTEDVDGIGITADEVGNAVLIGNFEGTVFLDDLSANGFSEDDVFMTKLYPSDLPDTIDDMKSSTFHVMPNPVSDLLKVEVLHLTGYSWKISAMDGTLVEVGINNQGVDFIDFSALNSGVYLLQIGEEVTRIIKN